MTAESIDVANILRWRKPAEVQTKLGARILRKATPTPEFWDAWNTNKEELRAAGVSVSKDRDTDAWEVCHWAEIPNAE